MTCLRNREYPQNIIAVVKIYPTNREVVFTQRETTTNKNKTTGCLQGSLLGTDLWNFLLDPLRTREWPNRVTPIAYVDNLSIVIEKDKRKEVVETAQLSTKRLAQMVNISPS